MVVFQGFPFFGVQPVILDESGKEIKGEGEGYLVFSRPWPGLMRTLYGDHDRYELTYFTKFPGYYCTGDGKFPGDNQSAKKRKTLHLLQGRNATLMAIFG